MEHQLYKFSARQRAGDMYIYMHQIASVTYTYIIHFSFKLTTFEKRTTCLFYFPRSREIEIIWTSANVSNVTKRDVIYT